MRWPTPPTGHDGAEIINTALRPATTPATEFDSHEQRSTTAVLVSMERPAPVPQVIDLRGSSTLERTEPQPEGAGRHEQCDAVWSDPSGSGRAQGFHLGSGTAFGA